MQNDEQYPQEKEPSLRDEAEVLLSKTIENRTIIERISRDKISETDTLIRILTKSIVGDDGAPHDYVIAEVPIFDCGCASQGRHSCGGVDYKGNTSCLKHFTNCCKCLRALTIGKTARAVQGQIYCPGHAFMQRVWLIIRWIFIRKQKEEYFDRAVAKEVNRQMNALMSQAKKNEVK